MNEEDEFTLISDGFRKAYPDKCAYRANGAFPVSAAAKMAAFPVRPRRARLFPWRRGRSPYPTRWVNYPHGRFGLPSREVWPTLTRGFDYPHTEVLWGLHGEVTVSRAVLHKL